MSNPNACIPVTDGTNCDMEMAYALEVAGAEPERVHINQLRAGERSLSDYSILAFPGGFTYGDDIASGRVLANELRSFMSDELQEFVTDDKPVLGVCNGFQVLVRAGLLPDRTVGRQSATLAENQIGRFECRWINLAVGESACRFIGPNGVQEQLVPMQTAHGEGRFFAPEEIMQRMAANRQVVFRYAAPDGSPAAGYPDNPNGSLDNIAAVCDAKGVVLGMMPHPERSVTAYHPHRVRTEAARQAASLLFGNIVKYAREL
jgi:phosphoribosylformylglycinamidine synthase